MDYFLKTERLGFRCWSEADLSLAIELWCDPKVNEFLGGPFTPEVVRTRLDREIALMQDFGFQYWPVFLLDGDVHVGCAGLRPYRVEDRIHELGYHLRPEFWGRGIAQEAARGVIGHAFRDMDTTALFAGHHPMNQESRRVLLKVGFVYAGEALYPPSGMIEPTYFLQRDAWQGQG